MASRLACTVLATAVVVLAMIILGSFVGVTGAPSTDTIEDSQTLALEPETEGTVLASHTFAIPDAATSFDVRLPADASVREADGFERVDDRRYAWDGTTANPTIRYEVGVDQTIERDDPIGGPGEYLFKDGGSWALIQPPLLSYAWSWDGDERLHIERSVGVDGAGMASERIAYLGEHNLYTHEAHGQQFQLVEPKRAELAEAPDDIFAALEHASDHLRVGARDDTVFMVAAPTDGTRWGVRGVQTGDADMWVRDRERLADPSNVWIHEYVHTRQSYATDPSARWFTEGAATYYAALFAYQTDEISYEAFRSFLDHGSGSQYEAVRLTEPASWVDHAEYFQAALVSAELDRHLRAETDAERAFTSVFSRFNEEEGEVTHEVVREALRSAGGEDVAESGDALLQGDRLPQTWDRDEHEAIFDTEPPRFATTILERSVDSEYRNRPLGEEELTILVPDEQLTVSVSVENRGERPGTTQLPVAHDDRIVDRIPVELGPGQETRVTGSKRMHTTGPTTLTVGESTVPVSVRRPSSVTVTDLQVGPRTVSAGEHVTARATVVNERNYPAAGVVTFTRSGLIVLTEHVTIDAEQTTEVTTEIRMPRAGTQSISVENVAVPPVEITVTPGESIFIRFTPPAILAGLIGVLAVLGCVLVWVARRGK